MDETEKQQRILHSLLHLPSAIAARIAMPINEARDWFEVAYFQHLRGEGLTLKEIAERLGVSPRKVSMLATRLRSNFLDDDAEHGLPRRIEYLVWGEPISARRIRQLLSGDYPDDAIDDAIELLIRQERVETVPGESVELLALSRREARLYQDDFMARLDGLNHLVETARDAIIGRFFEDDPLVFARNLTLRVPADGGREELERAYERLFERLAELDDQAAEDPDGSIPMNLSVLWAPKSEDDDE